MTPAELRKTGKKNVWVYIEQRNGIVNPVSFELLGRGRDLADELNGLLVAVLPGENVKHLSDDAFAYGADQVILIDSPLLKDYRTYPYKTALVQLITEHRPNILLLGATTLGRDLAGAVASRVETGLTADCTVLAIDPETGLLTQTRPAFGGNILATIICRRALPQMATVRPRVFKTPVPDRSRRGELIEVALDLPEQDIPTTILECISHTAHADVEIDQARVLIAGGRGVGGADNFRLLKELAELLNGELAASRPVVEMGWLPYDRQVGQTGKTVRPKLYIAAGISGAIQHLVGIENADIIVAINKDPGAPIFKLATYGIVGDLFEVIPALIEQIKTIKAKLAIESKTGAVDE